MLTCEDDVDDGNISTIYLIKHQNLLTDTEHRSIERILYMYAKDMRLNTYFTWNAENMLKIWNYGKIKKTLLLLNHVKRKKFNLKSFMCTFSLERAFEKLFIITPTKKR